MSVIHQSARRPGPRTVLTGTSRGDRWELVRIRIKDRLLAGWRGLALDVQLADGQRAEDDRLRAVRASTLTTPAARHRLVAGWENVLSSTTLPRPPGSTSVPVQAFRVLAAEDDIRHLISLLRAPTPVSARGLAIASVLLTDGTGPLYNAASTSDLASTIRDAIGFLDPMADFST
jgi:hypothetical protein